MFSTPPGPEVLNPLTGKARELFALKGSSDWEVLTNASMNVVA